MMEGLLYALVVLLGTILVLCMGYAHHAYQYWKKRGVPYLEPRFPGGNFKPTISSDIMYGMESKDWYDALKKVGHKFGGIWTYTRPVLVLVDPEYIKDILIRDFNYFSDRDIYCNERDDPHISNLFMVGTSTWRTLRQKLTPTFTSGKMKMMFNWLLESSEYMVEEIEKDAKLDADINIRGMLQSFTIDVIGKCAFGIDCNSFKNPDGEFKTMARELFSTTVYEKLKRIFVMHFRQQAKTLSIVLSRQRILNFFCDMVAETIEYRVKNGIHRPDFIQLMMELQENSKNDEKPFTVDHIVANAIIFFIAGFDTSSTTMNFSLYGLAQNPEMQEKARNEIEQVLSRHDGKITYDSLKETKYLVQVIYESQRQFPPLPTLARICMKDYKLRDTDIVIEKGTPVAISTLGLGMDPEYFPNPEQFDPERFSEENISKRHPCIHIPFGEGPRNCIGLRFGMMQSQIGLIQILRKFRLSISPKTKLPVKRNETLYFKAERI